MRNRLGILLLAPLLPLPLAAQPWAGTAALGVEVADRRGQPVSDAAVELAFLGEPERGGPAPARTDERGRLEVYGLAEGRWVIRIHHPAFLGYEADLELRSGRKAREGSVARLKDGESIESSRVRYFKVEGPKPSAPPTRRPAPAPSERQPTVAPEPVADAPPTPAMPPATADPPDPSPNRPAADLRFLRSPRDGTCFDCRPGEWAVFVDGEELGGDATGSGCAADLQSVAASLLPALDGGRLTGYAGPLPDGEKHPAAASSGLRSALAALTAGSRCRYLVLWLPAGARFGGFQYEVSEGKKSHPCLPGSECPLRDSRFPAPPGVATGDDGTLVVGAFDHQAPQIRRPRLTVYFVPGSRWQPAR